MKQELARAIVRCLGLPSEFDASVADLRSFNHQEWMATLPWLHESGLALYFLQRLEELKATDKIPAEIHSRLHRNAADNRERLNAMAEEFSALNECFERGGVRFAVLKGFSMVPDYCPDASLRTQADFDYLVASECVEQADRALRGASYIRKGRGEGQHSVYFHSRRPLRLPSGEDDLYSARLPRRVELHTFLWEPGPTSIRPLPLATALRRLKMRRWQDIEFPALADEDALLFHLLHALRHIFENWCRLSILLEVACLLRNRSCDEAFWRRFRDAAESGPGVPQIAGVVISLASNLFANRLPPGLGDWIDSWLSPPMRVWLERYGLESALTDFMGNKFNLFLLRQFVTDDHAWRKVELNRLFPRHLPNRAAEAENSRLKTQLSALGKQAIHSFRRLKFHAVTAVHYRLELPRWRRMVRSASTRPHADGSARLEVTSRAMLSARAVSGAQRSGES